MFLYMLDHYCPCFGLLVVCALGFKARVDPSLAYFCHLCTIDSRQPAFQLSLSGPPTYMVGTRNPWLNTQVNVSLYWRNWLAEVISQLNFRNWQLVFPCLIYQDQFTHKESDFIKPLEIFVDMFKRFRNRQNGFIPSRLSLPRSMQTYNYHWSAPPK